MNICHMICPLIDKNNIIAHQPIGPSWYIATRGPQCQTEEGRRSDQAIREGRSILSAVWYHGRCKLRSDVVKRRTRWFSKIYLYQLR